MTTDHLSFYLSFSW